MWKHKGKIIKIGIFWLGALSFHDQCALIHCHLTFIIHISYVGNIHSFPILLLRPFAKKAIMFVELFHKINSWMQFCIFVKMYKQYVEAQRKNYQNWNILVRCTVISWSVCIDPLPFNIYNSHILWNKHLSYWTVSATNLGQLNIWRSYYSTKRNSPIEHINAVMHMMI